MDQRDQGPYGGAVQGGTVYASPNDFPVIELIGIEQKRDPLVTIEFI